jgi:hypothetical protein
MLADGLDERDTGDEEQIRDCRVAQGFYIPFDAIIVKTIRLQIHDKMAT